MRCLRASCPVVAYAVLSTSPADLEHVVVTLEDLWSRDAARIREQLSDARSWQDRFAMTEALFARRRETRPSVNPHAAWAWRGIVGSRGRVRIEALAVEVGWSRSVA